MGPEDLRKQLQSSDKRMMKYRNEITLIKQENDKMSQILKREIGGDASIDDLLRDESKWKGRAQKIAVLKE